MEKIMVTQQKFDELTAELQYCMYTMRGLIGTRVAEARALGDLSENAEYHAAREEQRKNESRIEEIEYTLKHAKIIAQQSHEVAELMARVTLQKKSGTGVTSEINYMLVSPAEADITQGKLSIESPIGKLLLGKRTGDSFEHTVPSGSVQYTIINIE